MSIQIMLNKWYNYPDKCAKSKVVINAIQVDIQFSRIHNKTLRQLQFKNWFDICMVIDASLIFQDIFVNLVYKKFMNAKSQHHYQVWIPGIYVYYFCIIKNIWKSATFSSKVTDLLGKKFFPPPPLSPSLFSLHIYTPISIMFYFKEPQIFLNKSGTVCLAC